MTSEHAPEMTAAFVAETVRPDPAIATEDGAVQFHVLGHTSDHEIYGAVLRQNAEILMGMAGLIHSYTRQYYPTVDRRVMNIDTWRGVLENLPDLAIGQSLQKSYRDRIAGEQVPRTLLGLIAGAKVPEDGSVLTDFSAYLDSQHDATFAASNDRDDYRFITCSFLNYLVGDGLWGYHDHAAIVLREVNFREGFQALRSSCRSAAPVVMQLEYTEIKALVQTRRLREGGADHRLFQNLIDPAATAKFASAVNLFNAVATPQSQLAPTDR